MTSYSSAHDFIMKYLEKRKSCSGVFNLIFIAFSENFGNVLGVWIK